MTLALTSTTDTATETRTDSPTVAVDVDAPWRTTAQTRVGIAMLWISMAAWAGWLGWRLSALPLEPRAATLVSLLVLALEWIGVLIGVLVAWGLLSAAGRQPDHAPVRYDRSHRFAHVVTDAVGRDHSDDVHHDVRVAVRAAPRVRHRSRADWVVAAVLADSPRRLAMVTLITIALLTGVSPMPIPPALAVLTWCLAAAAMAAAHTMLSGNAIAIGDRLRWTYSSLGEIVVRDDVDGVAPRRWVGTVAAVVALNLALALRGISDRWTHGLPAMDAEHRKVVMVVALLLVLGALYTLATMPTPQLDNAHLVARRLEERTARQSLLAMAIVAGLVGLLAGLFTGDVDAADGDSARIEHRVEAEWFEAEPLAVVGE